MNMATSLNMMVKMGIFEKMPKQGSINAVALGKLANLEPSVIGKPASKSKYLPRFSLNITSTADENAHWDWYRRVDWRG